jgi:lysylphosphatidylglycerol synthetase-like protein (DUF2156 family)
MLRLTAVANIVSLAARRAALVAGVAALAVAILLGAEPRLGFGWGAGVAITLGLMVAVPAGVLLVFSVSTARLGKMVAGLPNLAIDVASEALDRTVGLAGAVQTSVTERRGIRRLLSGIWGLRRLVGRFRELAGEAMPAVAAMSPAFLLATALAVFAGVGVVLVAMLLGLARMLV